MDKSTVTDILNRLDALERWRLEVIVQARQAQAMIDREQAMKHFYAGTHYTHDVGPGVFCALDQLVSGILKGNNE